MPIFVVRHGQTDENVAKRVCSITDVSLNEEGIKQAKELALNIRELNITKIFSSPLIRAKQTAQILASSFNIDIIVDERLTEQNYGKFEGVNRNDPEFLKERIHFANRFNNGESLLQVAQRIYNFLDECKDKYKDENILIVTHGGVIRVINSYFNDIDNLEYGMFVVPNAKEIKFDFKE